MKYSILIPAFKSRFLQECIDSVLAQSYADFELIVLNDCSPESVRDIVSGYSDNRIRYYENETNTGAEHVVRNWNKLLSLASGDFVICMGDDDKLAPDCLEAYNVLIERHPFFDVYHARTWIIDEDSEIVNIQEARPETETAYSMAWHIFYCGRCQFIGDYLFRTSSLKRIGGFYDKPFGMASDIITCLLSAKEHGIANLSRPVFLYRTSRYTITSTPKGKIMCQSNIEYVEFLKEFLSGKRDDKIDQTYCTSLLHLLDWHFVRMQCEAVATNVACDGLRSGIYWMRNRKRIKLTIASVSYAIALGLYRKHYVSKKH